MVVYHSTFNKHMLTEPELLQRLKGNQTGTYMEGKEGGRRNGERQRNKK